MNGTKPQKKKGGDAYARKPLAAEHIAAPGGVWAPLAVSIAEHLKKTLNHSTVTDLARFLG